MERQKEYYDIRVLEDPMEPDGGPTFKDRVVPVHRDVLKRLIQEEIWAQTEWPEGEPSLSELLGLLERTPEGHIDLNRAERVLSGRK